MGNTKQNWLKLPAAVILTTIVNIALHIADGTKLPTTIDPFSMFCNAIGARPVVVIFFLVFFTVMSISFVTVERRMSGSKLAKGLKFGIVWGIIFFLGVVEEYPVFGKTAILSDIRLGLVDFASVVFLGALLGNWLASDGLRPESRHVAQRGNNALIVSAATLSFVIGRYFAYTLLNIESGFIERPISTFIWTLATGVSFGALYILTAGNDGAESRGKRLAIFGLTNLGLNWLAFNLFWPFVYESSLPRLLSFIFERAALDTVCTIAGIYAIEKVLEIKSDRAKTSTLDETQA